MCNYASILVWKDTIRQIYMYELMQVCMFTSMNLCKSACIQVCIYASLHVFKYAVMQVCLYESLHVCKSASLQV